MNQQDTTFPKHARKQQASLQASAKARNTQARKHARTHAHKQASKQARKQERNLNIELKLLRLLSHDYEWAVLSFGLDVYYNRWCP